MTATPIAITLRLPSGRSWDIALPADVPIGSLLQEIRMTLQIPEDFTRLAQGSSELSVNDTLESAGILIGTILTLYQRGQTILPEGQLILLRQGTIQLNALGKKQLLVGRPGRVQPDIDLSSEPLGDSVSREHARLNASGGNWTITIISEKNPSSVNDISIAKLHSYVLKTGDRIKLGECEVLYVNQHVPG